MHPVKSSSNHTDPIANHNKDLDQIHVHAIPSKNSEIPKTTIPPTQNVNKTPQNPSLKIDNKNLQTRSNQTLMISSHNQTKMIDSRLWKMQ